MSQLRDFGLAVVGGLFGIAILMIWVIGFTTVVHWLWKQILASKNEESAEK